MFNTAATDAQSANYTFQGFNHFSILSVIFWLTAIVQQYATSIKWSVTVRGSHIGIQESEFNHEQLCKNWPTKQTPKIAVIVVVVVVQSILLQSILQKIGM